MGIFSFLNPFKKKEKIEKRRLPELPEIPEKEKFEPLKPESSVMHTEKVDDISVAPVEPISQPMGVSDSISNKDIQIISGKIDLINAKLDNLNQRIAVLERTLQGERRTYF